jgi:hypothetical protein
MTVAEIETRTLKRLDDDGAKPTFWSGKEFLAALNEAQRFFVLLTLCLEKTAPLALQPGVAFYRVGATYGDWIVPLRVTVAGTGLKVRPARLAELDAENSDWQHTPGTPARYACLGFDLVAVTPQPAAGGTSLDVTYARAPTRMTAGTETPEIPEEYHGSLIDYAIPRLRMKEGGQEFAKTLPLFKRFLADVTKLATYVRRRNLGQSYDTLPIELERFDASKLFRLAMQKERPWQTTSQ